MLCTRLHAHVSAIRLHRVFFAMQQFGDLRDMSYIGYGAMDMMDQARLGIV